jgi:hypothetical protein
LSVLRLSVPHDSALVQFESLVQTVIAKMRSFKANLVDVDFGHKKLVLIEGAYNEESARSELKESYGDAYRVSQLQELDEPGSRTCRECGSCPAQTWMQQPDHGPIFPVCLNCKERIRQREVELSEFFLTGVELRNTTVRPKISPFSGQGVSLKFAIILALLAAAIFALVLPRIPRLVKLSRR